MGTRYNINITATDAATARVQAIKKSLRSIVSPITEVGRSVRGLGREIGVDKLAKGVGTLGTVAEGAVRSIGGLGGAVGGLAGGLGVASVLAYSRQWGVAQQATALFASTAGVAFGKLQTMEGGARAAGLSAADLDGAVQSLGTTLQDARWGRNQGALLMMNRLGIKLKTTKEGVIDTASTLGDLADVFGPGGKLASAPVQTKALVAQQFGVEALLPILLQGRKAWDDYQRAAAKVKPPLSEQDQRNAAAYAKSLNLIGLSFEGIGNSIMNKAIPGLTAFGNWITQHNTQIQKNVDKFGIGGAVAHGYSASVNDIWQTVYGKPLNYLLGRSGAKPKRADPRLEQESIDDFKRMGWSDAQAKGLVANMVEESGLDPRAVGDNGQAKGLLQFHRDRQQNYARFASGRGDIQGKSIDSASAADQRKFINYELRYGAEQAPGRKLASQTDAANAAAMLSQSYVRPADELGSAFKRAVTAKALDKALPSTGLQPSPDSGQGATGLAGLYKSAPKPATSETTVNLKISGLPAGAKAEVSDSKGPVQTVLKVDYSMPDYGS